MASRFLAPAVMVIVAVVLVAFAVSGFVGSPAMKGRVASGAEEGEAPASGWCSVAPFYRGAFTDPITIHHGWLPLAPGTQRELQGTALMGGVQVERRVITTVTGLTKVIDGVRSAVIYEEDFTAGQLTEVEIAFIAQDDLGNVWNLGEHPVVFEDGASTGATSTWASGIDGAQAGIRLPAAPSTNLPRSSQGLAPDASFADCGQVVETGATVCIRAFGCWTDVVVVIENSPLERRGASQLKSYAPGLGLIKVDAIADPESERLELVRIAQLSGPALSEIQERALLLEGSAYGLSPAYRQTEPISR